jgi:hypothetical protein
MDSSAQRLFGRFLLVANLAAATAAAAVGVVAFVRPGLVGLEVDGPVATMFGGERVLVIPLASPVSWSVFLAALLLLLTNFGWLVRRAPAPAPRNYIVSETPTGPVRVAREALEAGLRGAGEALPEITRLRVVVDCGQARRILVRSHFQVAEGVSNLGASQRLRAALHERLLDMVQTGSDVRVEYELEFQGFAGKVGKRGDVKAALEAEPPPFTGPKYPIEPDDSGGN